MDQHNIKEAFFVFGVFFFVGDSTVGSTPLCEGKSSVLMVQYSTVQYMEVFGFTMMISPHLPRMEIKEDR